VKTGCWADTDAEARKPGEQTGLDTPVVLALNDEYLVSGVNSAPGAVANVFSIPPVREERVIPIV
jgi:hypothetical protein